MEALLQLFLDTLIDQHVGVHCSTQGEHDTCDTRHGESGLERGQDTEREEQVEQQGAVGQHTRDEVIEQHHDNHQEDEGHDEGDDTLLDGLRTERRSHHLV